MTLADTSAWVEYLKATGSRVHHQHRELLDTGELATTDIVLMELLAGARDHAHAERLGRLLARCGYLALKGPGDFEAAAHLYRRCRARGVTVRQTTDCLIATVAISADVPVLHLDRDFDAIAEHTALRLV